MYDKNLFDRNAFDRSVSSDSINITMISQGNLGMKVVMRTTVPLAPIRGGGDIATMMIVRHRTSLSASGSGDIAKLPLVLKLPLSIKVSGNGAVEPGLAVKTPIPTKLNGSGMSAISNQMIVRQNVVGALNGYGVIDVGVVMQSQIPMQVSGGGEIISNVVLQLPLGIQMSGSGSLILNRIGARNENVLELIGINLLPGETVTIDTDLLQVLFGTREDVGAVTSDSVFFELFPGANEIVVSTDTDQILDVTAIWQNRWL